jgi:hypothetical protein
VGHGMAARRRLRSRSLGAAPEERCCGASARERLLVPLLAARGQPSLGQRRCAFLVGCALARASIRITPRTRLRWRCGGVDASTTAASTRRRRRECSSRAASSRREPTSTLRRRHNSLPPLDLGTYATFASASFAPGRRLSSAHPTPPTARHMKGMTVNEGSTPKQAAVCSAIVSGMEYPTTSKARSTS